MTLASTLARLGVAAFIADGVHALILMFGDAGSR
jgi:hypothetical protein